LGKKHLLIILKVCIIEKRATPSSPTKEANMLEQVLTLKAAARGYMMMAMVMREAGYEESCKAYLKSEAKCFSMALEIEDKLDELESYMLAA
jgi:hypothetical protein